jgi:hypothetical protein
MSDKRLLVLSPQILIWSNNQSQRANENNISDHALDAHNYLTMTRKDGGILYAPNPACDSTS